MSAVDGLSWWILSYSIGVRIPNAEWQFGQLVAECESCAVEARSATALRDPVDRLLAAALEATEFARDIRAWRRVDMAAWADISQRWAKERVRLLDHLSELSRRRPRDVL